MQTAQAPEPSQIKKTKETKECGRNKKVRALARNGVSADFRSCHCLSDRWEDPFNFGRPGSRGHAAVVVNRSKPSSNHVSSIVHLQKPMCMLDLMSCVPESFQTKPIRTIFKFIEKIVFWMCEFGTLRCESGHDCFISLVIHKVC